MNRPSAFAHHLGRVTIGKLITAVPSSAHQNNCGSRVAPLDMEMCCASSADLTRVMY